MNDIIGCLVVCKRDESMIDEFIRSYKLVYPHMKLILLSDISNPISSRSDLDILPTRWDWTSGISTSLTRSLLFACQIYKARGVIKFDVDAIHNSSNWMEDYHDYDAIGYQHQDRTIRNDLFFGLTYYVNREYLGKLLNEYSHNEPTIKSEDQCISYTLRLLNANIKIIPLQNGNCVGVNEDNINNIESLLNSDIIHCGQLGKSYDDRFRTAQLMRRINNAKFN